MVQSRLLSMVIKGRPSTFSRTRGGLLHQSSEVDVGSAKSEFFVLGEPWMFLVASLPAHPNVATVHQGSTQWHFGTIAGFMPGFSMIHLRFLQGRFRFNAYYAKSAAPSFMPREGVVYSNAPLSPIETADDVFRFCKENQPCASVENIQSVSALARQAKELIERQYRSYSFSISALASQLRVSRSVLSRYFRGAYGLPPLQYVLQLRTSDAIWHLLMENLRVIDTSHQVGFSHTSQFHRHFRKFNGISPAACRGLEL